MFIACIFGLMNLRFMFCWHVFWPVHTFLFVLPCAPSANCFFSSDSLPLITFFTLPIEYEKISNSFYSQFSSFSFLYQNFHLSASGLHILLSIVYHSIFFFLILDELSMAYVILIPLQSIYTSTTNFPLIYSCLICTYSSKRKKIVFEFYFQTKKHIFFDGFPQWKAIGNGILVEVWKNWSI